MVSKAQTDPEDEERDRKGQERGIKVNVPSSFRLIEVTMGVGE